jgi:hypothetical protein
MENTESIALREERKKCACRAAGRSRVNDHQKEKKWRGEKGQGPNQKCWPWACDRIRKTA